MKILHINDYPPAAGGGAEVVMSQTIDLLHARGHVVETFTAVDLANTVLTPLRYLDNAFARQALADKLTAFRPNVVHLHNFYHLLSPGILAELNVYKQERPLRVVMTAHDYHLVSPNSAGSSFAWWSGRRQVVAAERFGSLGYLMTRRWDHRSWVHSWLKVIQHIWHYRWHGRRRVIDHAICPSRFVERMLASTGLQTSWLPHPVPPSTPRSHAPRGNAAPRGNVSGPLRFVFAGRIEPEKGLFEFLQTLPADFGDRLTIIGTGADFSRCRTLAAARPWRDRVEFLGRLSHAQTLTKIAEAHVLVQPSRVLETYGLTLIEALSVGTNVLASDRGALREIVDDSGVGFLYDLDDPATLVQKLGAIRRAHADASLNRFSIVPFLDGRSEARYVDGLLERYANDVDCEAPPLAA